MFKLTSKLRRLKPALRQLHFQHTNNITSRVAQAKASWDAAQYDIDNHPESEEAKVNERHLAAAYMQLCKDEESYFKQKSRIQWLQLGDRNTSFFHKSLLHRQVRNNIYRLQDDAGTVIHDQQEIGNMASTYFQRLLCVPNPPILEDLHSIYPATISEASKSIAEAPITNDDIQAALFSIPDTKAPGPDGYNAFFFKKCWDIIKVDFTAAIRYFFLYNTLPRCVNATRVSLVPKQEHPACLNDYRPISCCNVLYKCIAKLLVTKLKAALADVIGPSQSAFVPGRNISDAILLTQELMHNYHHKTRPARCALKIDLRKAFDTVSLEFILAGLHAIDLPPTLINWIKTCITTVHYTININGELHGFFQSTRGIRQGDPLSPYLFVLAMEGLSGIIRQTISSSNFQYHWRCKPTNITHLCFADDLMMFCHADTDSIRVLKTSLDIFSSLSGLHINLAKCSLYLSGIDSRLRSSIADSIGIQEKVLPVRYLGVPLISTRLTHTDCIPLMERIIARIKLWTSSSLTYAGRLQLIKSVLFSIQVYWSTIFILPCATIKQIESILAAFLWRGTSLSHAGAKVAWQAICYPEKEGGLGVKRLKIWNQAATLKHIWHLLTNKTNVWTSWIHAILLRGRSFWQIPIPSNPSWSWRKILQSREWCRGWFTVTIGNGSLTHLWYDYWLPEGKRLIDTHQLRTLTATGLPWNAKVSNIITDGHWQFPMETTSLHAQWNSINFHPKPFHDDQWVWTGQPSGKFTIHSAWELLRDRRPLNTLHLLLWFKGHIPRQSFILWLASMGRLHTMDRLQMAGIISNASCILCGLHTETHGHLFFECPTSQLVWQTVNAKANIYWPCCTWQNLLQWGTTHYSRKKDIQHLIARLVLSASVYILWHERNKRVFNHQYQSAANIAEEVFQQVRTQITTMEFRGTIPAAICNIWGIMDDRNTA
ncbi:hypothetical protein NC653_041365 [Populus alba x Populus x berolinensis]|uniref:Reverse transcriptase domain-containing protein n=2 Tax=Populus TaxID=3689 RepID=A0AAD6LAS2_9ROSI|nr:hypothetical protein NC653_041365 [Populus alba x Populus x berolinensis]